ncbi:baculoviral IAP repeat-containing protein 5-like [Corticium candelabrum]|uniref:baculoviral IAP repeat-containing protein 5-like n=1 Tax=Corticium candelabrum TaxID=121492 RepID=UPI002E31ED6A|nr:baculoviral IAP repeat-containing protein 5-like [Corticium candelabrum]
MLDGLQEGLQEGLKRDLAMKHMINRLESFKEWPFQSDCNCTPLSMAEAGLYHCPTDTSPDLVRCFVCGLELDWWDPADIPWEEHAKFTEGCPWIAKKLSEKMGTKKMLMAMMEICTFILKRWANVLLDKQQEYRQFVREKIEREVLKMKKK